MHGAGKIPVMPNYMISASDDAVVLRNYEGMIFRYAPEDTSGAAKPIVSRRRQRGAQRRRQAAGAGRQPRMTRRRKIAAEKGRRRHAAGFATISDV